MRVSRFDFESGSFEPLLNAGERLGMIVRGGIHIQGVEPHPFPKMRFAQWQTLKMSRCDGQHSHDDLPRESTLTRPARDRMPSDSARVAPRAFR